jgi:hypothetical protein
MSAPLKWGTRRVHAVTFSRRHVASETGDGIEWKWRHDDRRHDDRRHDDRRSERKRRDEWQLG